MEEIDEISEIKMEMLKIINLDEIAYTELIISIDVTTSNGKIAFHIVKRCKTKDYPDGNVASTWEKLKNKYEPISTPSMVKLDKLFRELSLKKGQDTSALDLVIWVQAFWKSNS